MKTNKDWWKCESKEGRDVYLYWISNISFNFYVFQMLWKIYDKWFDKQMNIDYAENRKCPKIINEYCWWVFPQLIISVKFYNDSLNLKK